MDENAVSAMLKWSAVVSLLGCLGSFAWAMRHFFTKPTGRTGGMNLIKMTGLLCGAAHLIAWVFSPVAGLEFNIAATALYAAAFALFWWALYANRRAPLSAGAICQPARAAFGGVLSRPAAAFEPGRAVPLRAASVLRVVFASMARRAHWNGKCLAWGYHAGDAVDLYRRGARRRT
jgi:hypothetical protein